MGVRTMGLDRFMGYSKPEKKKTKKTTKKVSSKKSKPKEITHEIPIVEQKTVEIPNSTPEVEKLKSFTFVTMHFKCPNPKCKKKKTIRKPHSFTPTEKELICPHCATQLKKSRSK